MKFHSCRGLLATLLFLFLASGCSQTRTIVAEAEVYSPQVLLQEQRIFADTEVPEVEDVDLLYVDPYMKQFVRDYVPKSGTKKYRFKMLTEAVIGHATLGIKYNPVATLTAAETFRQEQGNCLAFSSLMVALAREAGFEAHYKEVIVPPVWEESDGTQILARHVAAVADFVKVQQMVDFNLPMLNKGFDVKRLSDEEAKALYYNNIAVDHMLAKDNPSAYAYLRRALEIDPENPDIWTNLGVVFNRFEMWKEAETAFIHSLSMGRHEVATTNLAKLYEHTGQKEKAEVLNAEIQRFRMKNPYHRFELAKEAFLAANYDFARKQLEKAVRLKETEHRFHFLLGSTYARLGDKEKARISFKRANELADTDIRELYQDKMSRLMSKL